MHRRNFQSSSSIYSMLSTPLNGTTYSPLYHSTSNSSSKTVSSDRWPARNICNLDKPYPYDDEPQQV